MVITYLLVIEKIYLVEIKELFLVEKVFASDIKIHDTVLADF